MIRHMDTLTTCDAMRQVILYVSAVTDRTFSRYVTLSSSSSSGMRWRGGDEGGGRGG